MNIDLSVSLGSTHKLKSTGDVLQSYWLASLFQHLLCAALRRPERPKQYCLQIETSVVHTHTLNTSNHLPKMHNKRRKQQIVSKKEDKKKALFNFV